MQKELLQLGLIGFGNVGHGVHNILSQNKDMIHDRIGHDFHVKTIVVRNPEKYQDVERGDSVLSTSIDDIINDPDIDIVVEVMGGETPAYEIICRSLKAGKYVVTANKEVVAKHKKEFFQLAKDHGVDIYFEASVGGGIPIIRALKVGYSANQIQSIAGILNGTTNFILSKIQEEKKDFQVALKEAQDLGFAEADPTMDVSGLDAAYKLVILAAVAFKADLNIEDIVYEGIENVGLKDVQYADELGYVIKLIASVACNKDGRYAFMVLPTMIEKTHPLAMVRNEFNAVMSVGNAMGESMLYGKGAGSFPTGSAVVSDLLDIAFDTHYDEQPRGKRNLEHEFQDVDLCPFLDTSAKYYIRLTVQDTKGVLEKVSHVLSVTDISVLKIVQKDVVSGEKAELVIITHETQEKTIQGFSQELEEIPELVSIDARYRVGLNTSDEENILHV